MDEAQKSTLKKVGVVGGIAGLLYWIFGPTKASAATPLPLDRKSPYGGQTVIPMPDGGQISIPTIIDLPSAAAAGSYTVNTQVDPLNMRSGPGMQYDITNQARKGSTVIKVDGPQGSPSDPYGPWVKVRNENGQVGWSSLHYLQPTSISAVYGGEV